MARKTIFDLQNKDIVQLIVNALRSYRDDTNSLGVPRDELESWRALQGVSVFDTEDNTIMFCSGKDLKHILVRITGE